MIKNWVFYFYTGIQGSQWLRQQTQMYNSWVHAWPDLRRTPTIDKAIRIDVTVLVFNAVNTWMIQVNVSALVKVQSANYIMITCQSSLRLYVFWHNSLPNRIGV